MKNIICLISLLFIITAAHAQGSKVIIRLKKPPPNAVVTENPTFQWWPVIPSPNLYRLQVYKGKEEQDATQAYLTNKPILARDYISTGAPWPANVAMPEGNYVWGVQALDANGNPFGEKSEGWSFKRAADPNGRPSKK